MKITLGLCRQDRGSALAVTVMFCAILGVLMGSYLFVVKAQQLSVARSQRWNRSLVVAEAGVDEAMALLNSGIVLSTFGSDGRWVVTSSNLNAKTYPAAAKQFTDSYYSATIVKTNLNLPVIIAKGYVPVPTSTQFLSRTVQVTCKPKPTFPVKSPMVVLTTFAGSGYNVASDSVATNSASSTNGDIVTLSTAAGAITIGNAQIKGSVRTPPGGVAGVTATIGPNGSVGDDAWVSSKTPGFEDGHFRDDVNMSFPDAKLPNVSTWYTPTGGKVNGVTYQYIIPDSKPYMVSSLSGSIYVAGSNSVLRVTTSINIGGNGQNVDSIYIAPGASVSMYMEGATASINGGGVVNSTAQAKNFQYYGLPTNTKLDLTGNGVFYGTIYAPEAQFNLKGGGNTSTNDFTGASITASVNMTGNFNFHYDEGLSTLTTIGGYDAIAWYEP